MEKYVIKNCGKSIYKKEWDSLFTCCESKNMKTNDTFISFLLLDEIDFWVYIILKSLSVNNNDKRNKVIKLDHFDLEEIRINYSEKNQTNTVIHNGTEVALLPALQEIDIIYFDYLKSVLSQLVERFSEDLNIYKQSTKTHFVKHNNKVYYKSPVIDIYRKILIQILIHDLKSKKNSLSIIEKLMNYLLEKGNVLDQTYDRAFEFWLSRDDLKKVYLQSDPNFSSKLNSWYEKHGFNETVIGNLIDNVNGKITPTFGKNTRNKPLKINMVMFQNNSFGLGKYGEDVNFILEKMGKATQITYVSQDEYNNLRLSNFNDFNYNSTTLFFINGDYAQTLFRTYPSLLRINHKIIVTHAETLGLKDNTLDGLKDFDEIWTSSSFSKDIFLHYFPDKFVKVIQPLYRELNHGIPKLSSIKKYLFFNFDYDSDINRKNPRGLINVFRQVNKCYPDLNLILKCKNSFRHPELSLELEKTLVKNQKIYYYDEEWSRKRLLTYIYNSVAYVSLHRAEGFGMNLFDSMSLGTCTIATGYSGNLDFMNNNNSCLVNYKIVSTTDRTQNQYNPLPIFWAEPDYSHAGEVINQIVGNDKLRESVAKSGKISLMQNYSKRKIFEYYRNNLFTK